jgi:hypothetical protein
MKPTTYVNRDKPPAAGVDPKAPARWQQVETGFSYTWHDHRTHWMGSQPPQLVRNAPKARHHIFDWKIGGRIDARPFSIAGSLTWVPPKSHGSYLWISHVAIAVGVLAGAAVLWRTRRGAVRRPEPAGTS